MATIQPSTASPSVANTPQQQRVLNADGGGGAAASTNHDARTPDQDEARKLHLIVGRSQVIDCPERLRRIYVANPKVLDSLTSSPHQIVLTAKLAGTSPIAAMCGSIYPRQPTSSPKASTSPTSASMLSSTYPV